MSTTYYKTAQDFDWYKYYPASFSTTTSHLNHVELGVYRRLLDHYWASDNKLPSNAAEIVERIGEKVFNWRRYGITAPAGFDNEEVTFRVVEHLLNEFFEQDEDGNWRHVWLDDYRRATDTQFQERSKASKERAARQSRGAGGKFGKAVSVIDGDVSPCLTVESTGPDGEVTVEKSREEQNKIEKSKIEKSKAAHTSGTSDGISAPLLKSLSPQGLDARVLSDEQRIAEASGCTVEHLMNTPLEHLTPDQRKARLKVIQQREPRAA